MEWFTAWTREVTVRTWHATQANTSEAFRLRVTPRIDEGQRLDGTSVSKLGHHRSISDVLRAPSVRNARTVFESNFVTQMQVPVSEGNVFVIGGLNMFSPIGQQFKGRWEDVYLPVY